MKVFGIIAGVVVTLLVIGLLMVGAFFLNLTNQDNKYRIAMRADSAAATIAYDNMWKEVTEKAQVSAEYKDAFNEALIQSMEARYGSEDRQSPLFKFINEQNPTMDPSLFKEVMHTITVQRAIFMEAQKRLISDKQQHDLFFLMQPNNFFLTLVGRQEMKITLITSSKTKKAYKSGEDDAIDVFGKKK